MINAGPRLVAIVTGASSGIGLNLTKALLGKGCFVMMLDRNAAAGERLAKEFNSFKPNSASFAQLDVTDKVATKSLLDKIVREHGRIDYFFPNAGIAEVQFIPNARLDTFNKDRLIEPNLTTLEVDLIAPIYSSGLVIQHMRKQEINSTGFRGKIICTASILGIFPSAGLPLYTTSKFGLNGYVRAMGEWLPEEGITMNSVCPALTPTGIVAKEVFDGFGKSLTPMETVIEAFMRCCETSVSGKNFLATLNGVAEAQTIKAETANCQADVDYLNDFMRLVPDGTE